jgi:hypothetical protein
MLHLPAVGSIISEFQHVIETLADMARSDFYEPKYRGLPYVICQKGEISP